MSVIYHGHGHRLTTFMQPLLSPANLLSYAGVIHQADAPLEHCSCFVNGTVRPICRSGRQQIILYNGRPLNCLIANLSFAYEGKEHDSGVLAEFGLLKNLENYSYSPTCDLLCIYCDPAYQLRPHPQAPFRITREQTAFNRATSAARVSVQWVFGDIVNFLHILDFKEDLKIHLSAVEKMYIVCPLLTNARTCLYVSLTSEYFNLNPPSLNQYFT